MVAAGTRNSRSTSSSASPSSPSRPPSSGKKKKAGTTTRNKIGHTKTHFKNRGPKYHDGQFVVKGDTLFRQLGMHMYPGENVCNTGYNSYYLDILVKYQSVKFVLLVIYILCQNCFRVLITLGHNVSLQVIVSKASVFS